MSEAPFKVGQRVRMTAAFPSARLRTGVVVSVSKTKNRVGQQNWWVKVRKDGASPKTRPVTYYLFADDPYRMWVPVPTDALTLDQTAQALADAVKRGDTNAALVLADRVFELCGGTPAKKP